MVHDVRDALSLNRARELFDAGCKAHLKCRGEPQRKCRKLSQEHNPL